MGSQQYSHLIHSILKFQTIQFTYISTLHCLSIFSLSALQAAAAARKQKRCQESNTNKNPSICIAFFVSPTNQKDRFKSITYSPRSYLVYTVVSSHTGENEEKSWHNFSKRPLCFRPLSSLSSSLLHQPGFHTQTKRNPLKKQFYRYYDFVGFKSEPASAELNSRSKSTRDSNNENKK